MSFLFALEEANLAEQLPPLFDKWEREISKAEPLFDLEGRRLEEVARVLPKHQAHYDLLAQDTKQLVKWLENYKSKLEARATKNINSGSRAVGPREAAIYINGEREIVEINQLIIETDLIRQKLDAIVESFRQMGWMVGNITKLRVASLNAVVL